MFGSRAARSRTRVHAGQPTRYAHRPRRRRRRGARPARASVRRPLRRRPRRRRSTRRLARRRRWAAGSSDPPARTARSASALFAPIDAEDRPARAALRTGKVSVIRHASRAGAQVADDPAARVSLRALEPGKRLAVCPSGPIPSQIRSNAWRRVAVAPRSATRSSPRRRSRGGVEVGGLGRHAMDPIRADARQLRSEQLAGDAEVRLGVVGRHGRSSPQKNSTAAPVDRVAPARLEEQRVDRLRRAAARQGHAEGAVIVDRGSPRLDESIGGGGADRGRVRNHRRSASRGRLSRALARRMPAARSASSYTGSTTSIGELRAEQLGLAAACSIAHPSQQGGHAVGVGGDGRLVAVPVDDELAGSRLAEGAQPDRDADRPARSVGVGSPDRSRSSTISCRPSSVRRKPPPRQRL